MAVLLVSLQAGINKDGFPDVVFVGSFPAPAILVCHSECGGSFGNSFGVPGCLPVSFDATGQQDLALGDFNGDTNTDIITTGPSAANIICLGDGAGGFSCSNFADIPGDERDIALGDVNGDTNLDAVIVVAAAPSQVCLGDGAGGLACSGFDPAPGSPLPNFNGIALGDVDGDLDMDAVLANDSAFDPSRVCFNNGSGVFGSCPTSTPRKSGWESG